MEATTATTTLSTPDNNEDKLESIKLTFYINGDAKKKFVNVPIEIAMMIPAIQGALLFGGTERTKCEYPLGEKDPAALKHYLSYKQSLLKKKFIPRMLGIDISSFIRVATFAHELGDFDFFSAENLELLFPDYESLSDEDIIDMPEEAMIFYVEKFLDKCFCSRDCICAHSKYLDEKARYDSWAVSNINEAPKWLKSFQEFVFWIGSGNRTDKFKYSLVLKLHSSGLLYRSYAPNEEDEDRFDEFESLLEPLDMTINRYAVKYLEEIPIKERKTIVSMYLMGYRQKYNIDDFGFMGYGTCKYKEKYICPKLWKLKCDCVNRPYYNKWSLFCSKRPLLAEFLWKFMDRKNILTIAEIYPGNSKYNKMLGLQSMEDLDAWVESFRPKVVEVDAHEQKLAENLRLAKKGEKAGRSSRYYDSEKIAQCEAMLSKYRGEKARKANQIKSIAAKKLWESSKYATTSDESHYVSKLKNVGKKRLDKTDSFGIK